MSHDEGAATGATKKKRKRTATEAEKLKRGVYLRGRTYWLKFQRGGKRRYLSLETDDPVLAVTRAAELRGFKFPDEPTALGKTITDFIADKKRLNAWSKATIRVHGAALDEFEEFVAGRAPLAVLKSDAAVYYAKLQARVKETTAQIHIRALRAFFNWCKDKKLCRANPFEELELATIDQKARDRFCTKQQRDQLIKNAPDDDLRFILLAGFDAGLRKNEIVEARASWFDLDGGALHLDPTETFRPKDRDARTIPLTERFAKFLRRYLKNRQPDDFAVRPAVKHGKGTYRWDFHRPWNDYMTAQKMPWVTAHVMRHTFASLLAQAGVSIFKIARWLGDGVEVVEAHYGHLEPKDADIERMS